MDRRRTAAGGDGNPPFPAGRRATSAGLARREAVRPRFLEKSTRTNPLAVPKPTQVGGYKNTKARERNLVKELGKIAP